MTAWKAITLSCDANDCDVTFDGEIDETTSVVRHRASQAGWAYGKGYDICPSHVLESMSRKLPLSRPK